jgi:tetratricopeptide (TPR) repeat protein
MARMTHRPAVFIWVALAMSALVAIPQAGAQSTEPENEWTKDVSEEQQAQASTLHRAGNEHLKDEDYQAALALFESAVVSWDHPGIRYNMAVALRQLNRPVEAYENLLLALRYGRQPLSSDEVYEQALAYKAELEEQVAILAIACREPGARVTLDGAYLFNGPGEVEVWGLVGEHQVVATLAGATVSTSIVILPHVQNRVQLPSFPTQMVRVVTQRWPTWKPWLLTAVGGGVAFVGAPFLWRARANLDAFDDRAARDCNGPAGCDSDSPELRALYDRGRAQNQAAVASFAVGGTLLVAGLTLIILNRPQSREVSRLVVAPEVSDEHTMVWGRLSF